MNLSKSPRSIRKCLPILQARKSLDQITRRIAHTGRRDLSHISTSFLRLGIALDLLGIGESGIPKDGLDMKTAGNGRIHSVLRGHGRAGINVISRCAIRAQTVHLSTVFKPFGFTLNEKQIPQIIEKNKNHGAR